MIQKRVRVQADMQKLADKITKRSGELAVYVTPSTGRLRCAGGRRRGPLEAMRAHGVVRLLGVYGRPWPINGYEHGCTQADMVADWMLEDLAASMEG